MKILEIIDTFHLIRLLSIFAVFTKIFTVWPCLKNYKGKVFNKRIATLLYIVPSSILLFFCLLTNHVFFMILLLIEKGITSYIAAKVLRSGEIMPS